MIEKIILSALSEELTEPAYMEAPEEKPARYIVLQKLGSSRENRLERARIAAQSIAETLAEAAELNEKVKAVMDELPHLKKEVFAAELNGDYNFTDTEMKERRYQAVYEITYKEW